MHRNNYIKIVTLEFHEGDLSDERYFQYIPTEDGLKDQSNVPETKEFLLDIYHNDCFKIFVT